MFRILLTMTSENVISTYNQSSHSVLTQERSSLTMEVVHSRIQEHNAQSYCPKQFVWLQKTPNGNQTQKYPHWVLPGHIWCPPYMKPSRAGNFCRCRFLILFVLNVSNNSLNNRIIFGFRQAFAHCCELPQV